jgi:hypothetical protein
MHTGHVIPIDRSFVVMLPAWAARFLIPLQCSCFTHVDLDRLTGFQGWFPEYTWIVCEDLFERLGAHNRFGSCLGLQDAAALIPSERFRTSFSGRRLMLWRSVALDSSSNLLVPWVQTIKGQMPVVYWEWFRNPINLETVVGLVEEAS